MPVRLAALALALLATGIAFLVFTMPSGSGQRESPLILEHARFTVAETPAALPATPFLDGKGAEITLEAFRGRPVLLNFWAKWCAPCVEELPSFDRFAATAKPGDPRVVLVETGKRATLNPAEDLAGIVKTPLEAFSDPDFRLMRALRISTLPTTILIDAEGREVARLEGTAAWDSEKTRAEVARLLSAPGS